MTINDAPMDELDLAIRREAAGLRADTTTAAHTDDAWDTFVANSATPLVRLSRISTTGVRHWRIAVAIGMVAALIAAVVVVRHLVDGDPTKLPVITPGPSTTLVVPALDPPYATMTLRNRTDLVAVGIDGRSQRIATNKPSLPDKYILVALSRQGWVAESGIVSEGFWFYNLRDPQGTRRVVSLDGPTAGSVSQGVWSPDGTLFAAVELDVTAVIINPATGELTRLRSAAPPVGYPPTWTADGTGLVVGTDAPQCLERAPSNQRSFSVVRIDGSIDSSIPRLADGLNHVTEDGVWVNDDLCVNLPSDRSEYAPTDIVVVDAAGSTSWISADDVAPAVLRTGVFASTRKQLWVVAERGPDDRVVQLYRVTGPHQYEIINTLPASVPAGSLVMIAGVSPDDSTVIVLANGPSDRRQFYLVPTDGSPPTTLDGEFAGFVPTSFIGDLS